ncbi:unnamed protein product [Thlaspi arvense]|uniref:PGG domain-containing protein n=1 Tax=Thlaspi arvense TaxID=13288 RepID=A0AAU9RE40_THLAR|nr:unnamed protein product [Thlaspi arvense]
MEGEEDKVAGCGVPKKKMAKQLTGKREDTLLHSAVRRGNKDQVVDILTKTRESELNELLGKQNQSGETALYVAAEYGDVEIVKEMINCYDLSLVEIKARNGFDAFHIAAKQGDLGTSKTLSKDLSIINPRSLRIRTFTDVLKVLAEAHSELAMTVDLLNTTALHTAATQGHTEVVKFLLELGSSLAGIAKSNGKTALHSASRNGHVKVVKALLASEPAIAVRMDKKGQTALHMAAKGTNVEVVEELIKADRSSINIADTKGNTALHIAARKGRSQIVKLLLANNMTDTKAVNRTGETALDTAEKIGNPEVALILQKHGVPSAKTIKPSSGPNPARELKQTVSDIKHEVHNQLEHTRQTRKRVQGIAKQLNKMHTEGLNNAINSTTVVAVLIATVAFAAIFTVPGQYVEDESKIPEGHSLGEANIASTTPFIIFFIFDSIALFISLAVVVVQTSVVVIESKAKKQMMAVINKLMWLACVLISVAFLALSFVVVGEEEKWLAIWVTAIGATIMITTLGTMCYWIIQHKIEAANARNIRRSSINSVSGSWGIPQLTDTDVLQNECKKMYAI